MWELFQKGGPVMYPIALCSIFAMGIFFERLWTYRCAWRKVRELARLVEPLVAKHRHDEAVTVCHQSEAPLAPVFLAALRAAGRPREQVKAVAEEAGQRQTVPLLRFLGLLSTIATLAPLLGLLGTVTGMIQCFNVIAAQGTGTPATLGGGISEALLTTAFGLIVAIPVILAHRFLSSRVEQLVLEMEEFSLRLVDLLGE
ncbi:MAG TPA: MotA/TolQ/ExbB proton channel family protein [Desulfobacterales bacterium]|nr:MotA/TolQ/ExbB proton channel family protein [Desulfobacterales bacterium]